MDILATHLNTILLKPDKQSSKLNNIETVRDTCLTMDTLAPHLNAVFLRPH